MQPFVKTLDARGILSFAPDSVPLMLTPLNVLIGPNASGKSNLIEVFELLKALPTDLAEVIREGGGVAEWIWKGEGNGARATIAVEVQVTDITPVLRYRLEFGAVGQRVEVLEEAIENAADGNSYYRLENGRPIFQREPESHTERPSEASRDFDTRQSIFSQRRDPGRFPEVTVLGTALRYILTFRDWSFGRSVRLRQPQRADLPNDVLLPDARNLGLILNSIEFSDVSPRLSELVRRFLPRFKRLSTKVEGGTIQIFLWEDGLRTPVPATRLSDGTLRFIALLAILLKPDAAPLICLEEPELGLHPDALAIIAELLVEASQQTQLVVMTQSDVLVSALSEHADSVVVCDNPGGGSQFSRLDSEKLRFWMDKYRLGDIWRIGELGGNP